MAAVISPKSLTCIGLVATGDCFSYDYGVSNEEMWAQVGRHLRHLREQKGFSSTIALARGAADPHLQKTLDRIERGTPGQLRTLHAYCEKLGTTMPDVLRAVLPVGAISGQAALIAQAYDSTDGKTQQLVEMALDVPPPAVRRGRVPAEPVGGPRRATGGSRERGRTARGHR
jgi:hypothetical protein